MLDARSIKEIECEFHSAEYQKLMEIITGLWTVSGHIKKVKGHIIIFLYTSISKQSTCVKLSTTT